MKAYVHEHYVEIELTKRNLEALLSKLDDPQSARTIFKTAEDNRLNIFVRAVPDSEHYADRAPGPVYMPSSGITY